MRYNPPLSTLMSTGSPMATAPILGLSHLTFIVRDVDRTAHLFCEGLGAQEVYDSQGRNFSLSREKFVLLGGLWLAFMVGSHRQSAATAMLRLPWLKKTCPLARRGCGRWGRR